MNLQQQQHFVDNFCEKMKSTILGKGNDYANADRLSNFKLAGAICGLTPEQNCLSMIATKVARLGVLLGGKIPNNESIEDSLLDLANYAVLLGCLRDEVLDKPFLMDFDPATGKMTTSEWVPDGYKPGVPPGFGVQESNTFDTIKIHEGDVVKDKSWQNNIAEAMERWNKYDLPNSVKWVDELVTIGNEDRSESFEKDLNMP